METIDFERIHQMFDGLMFDLCAECGGGGCEYNTMAILFPGEAEFVAEKMGVPVEDFLTRHCYTIQFQGHALHMLKGVLCAFLNAEYRCELEKYHCKLVQCLVYPAMIGSPGDNKRISIDHQDCPMAHRVSAEFTERAFAVLELLRPALPEWWLEFNLEHGRPLYDYEKFAALGDKNEISVEELKSCRAEQQ